MIHIIDSQIFGSVWGTEEMREIFDEERRIQGWLDVIAALARAQGELGIIPREAAEEIRRRCNLKEINLEAVRKGYEETGHSTLGLIRELKRVCRGDAGEWVYFGATVQDITDTWLSLALLRAHAVISRDVREVIQILLNLAEQYRDALMVGRTHGQQGLPVTFGMKMAVWAAEFGRHAERLDALRTRLGEGQLAGAVGTLSAFKEQGLALQERFFQLLGLRPPLIHWLNSRDNLVEYLNTLSLIGNSFDKIGHEIYNLQRNEISEVKEGFLFGTVGSITMPHKRNPEISEHLGTLARLIRHHAQALSENMVHDHERDGRSWKAEWAIIPPAIIMTGALLKLGKRLLENLEVDTEKMMANLNAGGGIMFSERVMLALARYVGKQTAHEHVYRIAVRSQEEKRPFMELIREDPFVRQYLSDEALAELTDVRSLAGLSGELVDRTVVYLRRVYPTDEARPRSDAR